MTEKTALRFGDLETYTEAFGDTPTAAAFARYDSIASCAVASLVGRAAYGAAGCVRDTLREAVHWQIRFMRLQGDAEQFLRTLPEKESFGGYTVERGGKDGASVTVNGIVLCPMTLSVLRTGGVISSWL